MRIAFLALLLCTVAAHAATVSNDDSCDISVLPAATLLLPYFEVDLEDWQGETTIFTVTNVTNLDQIARVTLWTDYAYPVINFNVYLTGYDVQTISLFDVLARGIVAPDAGTGTAITKRGPYSDHDPGLNLSACDRLPGALDPLYVRRMQDAFLRGKVGALGNIPECSSIGGVHERAIGYATIDVVGNCTVRMATDPRYWTEDIRYDNVLIGDYQQINSHENFAQGGSLVHIRAVPEGGTAENRRSLAKYDAGFPQTFYGRFQSSQSPMLDGRQPLPSTFAARWISGGTSGFETSLKIWRDGRTGPSSACADYNADASQRVMELVTFDESGNSLSAGATRRSHLPATSRSAISDASLYPQLETPAGWLYLNLDEARGDGRASQGWVISSMRAEGRFSTDIDAVALGNGCSAALLTSSASVPGDNPIAPAPNGDEGTGVASTGNDDSCDIALLPAATLLLPYFEVDIDNPTGEQTLFTVTNVSPHEQIAHVTLWTDYGYPVLDFNIVLSPYDVQGINLYDVLVRGVIAPGANRRHACASAQSLPAEMIPLLQQPFILGSTRGLGPLASCNVIGNAHDNAVGYATIDIVRGCASAGLASPDYWSKDLGYDNVLTGDYQQVVSAYNYAQGSPLVHVRAIPEGGAGDARFEHTFYGRFQKSVTPRLDGRQPLPSAFAARWIQGGAGTFQTFYKIWRSGRNGLETCSTYPRNGQPPVADIVTFDEKENAVADFGPSMTLPIEMELTLPMTSLTSVDDSSVYPKLPNGAVAGWMYFNLDEACNHSRFVCTPNPFGAQGWVVASMRSHGRYSVDMDATSLGNGCSTPAAESEVLNGTAVIGPALNKP